MSNVPACNTHKHLLMVEKKSKHSVHTQPVYDGSNSVHLIWRNMLLVVTERVCWEQRLQVERLFAEFNNTLIMCMTAAMLLLLNVRVAAAMLLSLNGAAAAAQAHLCSSAVIEHISGGHQRVEHWLAWVRLEVVIEGLVQVDPDAVVCVPTVGVHLQRRTEDHKEERLSHRHNEWP
jgi:hypothetical protein